MKLLKLLKPNSMIPLEPAPGLMNLPPELVLQVLDELDNASFCALGCTCTYFNALVFPYFFQKHNIIGANPAQGRISCSKAPEHTLRAIRCSLAFKDVSNICYHFNKGVDTLLEELEEMHAIVKRTKRVTNFEAYLSDLDEWASTNGPVFGSAPTDMSPLTEEQWTSLYIMFLTASLTKGCKSAVLAGGGAFMGSLRYRVQLTPTSSLRPGLSSVEVNESTNFFDGSFDSERMFVGPQAKRSGRIFRQHSQQGAHGYQNTIPTGRSDDYSTTRRRRNGPRFLKWLGFPSKKLSKDPPATMLQTLILESDMLLTRPTFLYWTEQLLSWCAPTLTHLALRCPGTPRVTWNQFFATISLPSLIRFEITCTRIERPANIQGIDVLLFLSRQTTIQELFLYGIQVPESLSSFPEFGEPMLPNLVKVAAHPIYIRWLLRDQEQYPNPKEVTLMTESYAWGIGQPFSYGIMDEALEAILPRSHQLDVIGLRLMKNYSELDRWLESHVAAAGTGNSSVLSRFIHTKRLHIHCASYVRIFDSPERLELLAQFVGLFPNLECLELETHPEAYPDTAYIPKMLKALRLHCPQAKKVKIDGDPAVDTSAMKKL